MKQLKYYLGIISNSMRS